MEENEILAEIHRTREAIARENDCDVAKLFAHFQDVAATLEKDGWHVAAPGPKAGGTGLEEKDSCVVREEPHHGGERD